MAEIFTFGIVCLESDGPEPCQCGDPFLKGSLRISTKNSLSQECYLECLKCFACSRDKYQFFSCGNTLPGWKDLRAADKRKVNKALPALRTSEIIEKLNAMSLDDNKSVDQAAKPLDGKVTGESSPPKTPPELCKVPLNEETQMATDTSDFAVISIMPHYVDKTLVVARVHGILKVILVTAPKRWGKSTIISTLKRFYEIEVGDAGQPCTNFEIPRNFGKRIPKDNTIIVDTENYKLFEKTELALNRPDVMKHLGKYPVIMLSFKGGASSNATALANCLDAIHIAYKQHKYLRTSGNLEDGAIILIKKWCDINEYSKMGWSDVVLSIRQLSEMLCEHWGRKCVILIDEYDSITMGLLHIKLDHDEFMIIQSNLTLMLTKALKENPYLEKGFITGISFVSGLWSELNHLYKCRFSWSHTFTDFYGLSKEEVEGLLEYNRISSHYECIQAYYNGYVTGNQKLSYPIWSIINYLDNPNLMPTNYWCHSSAAYLLYESFSNAQMKETIQKLINGDVIAVQVSFTFLPNDFRRIVKFAKDPDSCTNEHDLVLSMFLDQGCLTAADALENVPDINSGGIPKTIMRKLKIPNEEVRSHFREHLVKNIRTTHGVFHDEFNDLERSFGEMFRAVEFRGELHGALENFLMHSKKLILKKYPQEEKIEHLTEAQFLDLFVAATCNLCPDFFREYNVKYFLNKNEGGKIDYCTIYKKGDKKIAFVLEVKINDTLVRAREQFIDNHYFRVLDDESFKDPTDAIFMCLRIGRSTLVKATPLHLELSYALQGGSPYTSEALRAMAWSVIKLPNE